jgi:hypothetical protein
MCENRMERTSGPKGDGVTGAWRKFYESFVIYTLLQVIIRVTRPKRI